PGAHGLKARRAGARSGRVTRAQPEREPAAPRAPPPAGGEGARTRGGHRVLRGAPSHSLPEDPVFRGPEISRAAVARAGGSAAAAARGCGGASGATDRDGSVGKPEHTRERGRRTATEERGGRDSGGHGRGCRTDRGPDARGF